MCERVSWNYLKIYTVYKKQKETKLRKTDMDKAQQFMKEINEKKISIIDMNNKNNNWHNIKSHQPAANNCCRSTIQWMDFI